MLYDIAIIGGGASGLMLASLLSNRVLQPSVIIFEKHPRVGKKLLATGNGTCNISNIKAGDISRYHGEVDFAKSALERFNPDVVMRYFEDIGLSIESREESKRRDGRLYPTCLQASAVLDCLRLSMVNVTEQCDSMVKRIEKSTGGFKIKAETKTGDFGCSARFLVIATGGIASPALGGGNNAYDILLSMGYTRTPLMPSIVQIKTDINHIKSVKGIRVDAGVSLNLDRKKIAESFGELLFTEYGLSGPVILDISRSVGAWENQRGSGGGADMYAEIDLLPDMVLDEVRAQIAVRIGLKRDIENLLTGLINKRVGQMILRYLGIGELSRLAAELSALECDNIAKAIKKLRIKVTATRGFNSAQVTAGGIDTRAFNPVTMESKRDKNLFVTGEVLNVDGDCGGFNLQWAWASAFAAADEITRRLG